jgi:hypothetical protein
VLLHNACSEKKFSILFCTLQKIVERHCAINALLYIHRKNQFAWKKGAHYLEKGGKSFLAKHCKKKPLHSERFKKDKCLNKYNFFKSATKKVDLWEI